MRPSLGSDWDRVYLHMGFIYSHCVGHDGTCYAVLKRVQVQFGRGRWRCDPGTQCSVHRVKVQAAHFGARMLKREKTGEGAMPNRIWLFQGVNVDEIV